MGTEVQVQQIREKEKELVGGAAMSLPARADGGFDDDAALCPTHDQEQPDANRRAQPRTPEMSKAAEWLERVRARQAEVVSIGP